MSFSNRISKTFLPCLASLFTNNSQQMPGRELSSDVQAQRRPGSRCVSVACCFSWNVRRLFDCSVSCDFRGPLSQRGNSLIRELRHSSLSLGRINVTLLVKIFLALLSPLHTIHEPKTKRRDPKLARTISFRNVETKNEIVASAAV